VLYRMVTLPVTLGHPNPPNHPKFYILHCLSYLDVQVDHSNSQLTDDKLFLKGIWSCHVTHFKFLVPPKYCRNGLATDFKFCTVVGHVKC